MQVIAGPGSGKTTTIEQLVRYLTTGSYSLGWIPTQEQQNIIAMSSVLYPGLTAKDIVIIAFNNDIKEEIAKRVPKDIGVYTFNGLGHSCVIQSRLKFQNIDPTAGQRALSRVLNKELIGLPYPVRLRILLFLKYINYFKEELLPPSPESFFKVYEKYNILPFDLSETYSFAGDWCVLAEKTMQEMRNPVNGYEYVDQVWVGMQILSQPRYKLAIIDEAQDTSVLRLEFALKVAQNTIWVGDQNQAINAFAGADAKAFETIGKICQHKFPLKTCFRSPPNHVAFYNKIRNAGVVAAKKVNGPMGPLPQSELVETIHRWREAQAQDYPQFNASDVESGANLRNHLIVGRTNAKVLKIAQLLTRNDVPCMIVKRDREETIEQMLLGFLDSTKARTLLELEMILQAKSQAALGMPMSKGAVLLDKIESLEALLPEVKTIEELRRKIMELNKDATSAVRLSTVHKAKGLEAFFTYIIHPPLVHRMAKKESEIEQEHNLEFVAYSRSKFAMYFITED